MPKKPFIVLGILVLILLLLSNYLLYDLKKQDKQRKLEIQNAKTEEIAITLIEGWNVKDIAHYLDKQGIVKAEDFLKYQLEFDKSQYSFLQNVPKKYDLEGFLFPDTYRLFASIKNNDAKIASEAVIKKLLDNFENKLPESAEAKAVKQGLSLYEAITLASIVEKETGRNAATPESKVKLDEERKIVAGIFYNRLRTGMALESDATINYVTGKNLPSPTLEDLQINSAYNTYKYPGLPPGPIANPSLSSIEAVLNPIQTDYYYFLHKQPSGEPVYSKTFEEHVENKFKYLK